MFRLFTSAVLGIVFALGTYFIDSAPIKIDCEQIVSGTQICSDSLERQRGAPFSFVDQIVVTGNIDEFKVTSNSFSVGVFAANAAIWASGVFIVLSLLRLILKRFGKMTATIIAVALQLSYLGLISI